MKGFYDSVAIIFLILLLIASAIVFSCMSESTLFNDEHEAQIEKLKKFYTEKISNEMMDEIRSKRIYFGHHSVGRNILSGIKELENYNPKFKLCLQNLSESSPIMTGCIGSSSVGENRDYSSKIDAFCNEIDTKYKTSIDIAIFKLCYVDMCIDIDVDKMFNYYRCAMDKVKKKYPELVLVHCTIPIKNEENKKNIMRNKYNKLMTKNYKGREPIFDIARIESTNLLGEDCAFRLFRLGLRKYPKLCPSYTDDGGHLNRLGQIRVAGELLFFLSKLGAQHPQ